mmetsp:Transcript_33648/g.49470  ORF Transcript_33648/g.49470 Transcript_33648/m.49470 type:complete len:241 (+) Transcript_33648:28-750(+)|eukprot:CAMPEP_0195525914 /NCGR_PEP_ID=MMETSP0794_2-20130614/26607_1 /TAXON_ID=515487 /ORGANISM="Stephanopyxis turris, Strain CCMP 815" /LENGTH=240 /DNA_ID=CAMNT_0040656479 /DNA_START=282 /DNA_END=1004 /DNA_ORIENTATION=+
MSNFFFVILVLLLAAAPQLSALSTRQGLRAAHSALQSSQETKIDASVFDKLEKIAAVQQARQNSHGNGFPAAGEVPTEGNMQGMMTVGGNGMPPSVPGNMTQQAIVQMMQGLSVERVEMTPYGKTVPQEPGVRYIIASGQQECMQCEAIVAGAHFLGQSFDGICEFLGHGNMAVNSKMCHAQAHVLQSCPEFVNDWCYQDFGGSQMLRSPCPPYLICHYCLGLNPLHCQRDYMFPLPAMH